MAGAFAFLKGAVSYFELASRFGKVAGPVLAKFKKRRKRLMVFGAGGTGKSTLGRVLGKKLDLSGNAGPYSETFEQEHVMASEIAPVDITIGPGQARRRASSWPSMLNEISSGGTSHIINVVAYGYHATILARSDYPFYTAVQSDEEFRGLFLEANRRAELDALQDIERSVVLAAQKIRMITVVTKEDLWRSEKANVVRHYTVGIYGTKIAQIAAAKGPSLFQHEVVFACLYPQNLSTADGFVVAETLQGYDAPTRDASLKNALKHIDEIVGAADR